MLISGLMRTYNEAQNLKISLPNWLQFCDEIVISDGGSTDDSHEVAESICGDKLVWLDFPGGSIHGVHHQNHAGQQLNYGLDHCNGEWIVTMDADSIYCERFCKDIRHILADAKYPAYVIFGAHVWNDWEEYIDHMMEGPGVVQIFRNEEGVRFVDRPEEAHQVHAFKDEDVGILKLGVFHWGYMDGDLYIDKLQKRIEVFKDDDDKDGLASAFSQALAHFSASGWGETRPIPWDDCHAACSECWMRKRALERRSDLDWTKKE